MTLEEAIDILDDNFTVIDAHGHYTDEEVEQARQMAIKALEQEPVLDKIRAEIEALSNANPSYWHSGDMVDRDDVLEIIDKYRAESETAK